MSEMSKKILEVVMENTGKSTEEIINALSRAFPRESYALLESYIYQLRNKGYLSVQNGDNRIVAIGVNPSAYVALRESNDASGKSASTQINIGSVGNISGQFAVGNKGGTYEMHVSKSIIHAMNGGLQEVLALADKQPLNPFEREQLKKVLQQIIESLEKSEQPPRGLIEQLDSFLQCHTWISAPLAGAFINTLLKLFQ